LGNVSAYTLRNLRSSLPLVTWADNRTAASGGANGETLAEAKSRGPLILATRDRAVTATDFEHLAGLAAPDVARVRCSDVGSSEPGRVRVLIVPKVGESPDGPGRIIWEQLRPSPETIRRVVDYLEERRVVGVRVAVEMPTYQGATVVARLRARRSAAPADVESLALDALYGYFHPVNGGPEGTGWPFGRPVQAGEVHAVLQGCPGVDFVEQALLLSYDVETGERGHTPLQRIELAPSALVFSFAHQVRVDHPE
jgi:predicted phage baseplate assembly protein